MIGHVLGQMFGWPSGNVVGNLLASALWAPVALIHLHRKIDRHQKGTTMTLTEILHALTDAVRISDDARGILHTAIEDMDAPAETPSAPAQPEPAPAEPQGL